MKQAQVATGTSAIPDEPWITDETRDLARAVVTLRSQDEALRFLRDLCTVTEIRELGERWHVARLLDAGVSYAEIARQTGASSATISRVSQWLRYGRGGYRLLIDLQAKRDRAHGGQRG